MEYRLLRNDATARSIQQLATKGTASQNGAWTNTGSSLAIQSSFQEFLTQATSPQTAQITGSQAGVERTSDQEVPVSCAESQEIVHTLQQGETVWDLARKKYKIDPDEILQHNGINNPNTLQVGQKIRIPIGTATKQDDSSQEVVAGWYGEYHHGRLMANGKRFDMHDATIAHRNIPIGSEVELENPKTGEKARAVVTDRGPYHKGRDVDLSYSLANRLSIAKQGVGTLKMRVL
jgi:rare lipoprotein A